MTLGSDDDDDDDDGKYQAPCLFGQQLSGALLGSIFGYGSDILFDSILLSSIFIGIGLGFGTLASAVAQPNQINIKEFILLTSLESFFCYLVFNIISIDLFHIIIVSVIVSVSSTSIKSYYDLMLSSKKRRKDYISNV
jgi:hypothetical protein